MCVAASADDAGLTSGGLDVEWFDWLIERVKAWPDQDRARDQLDAMTLDLDYRAGMEKLPMMLRDGRVFMAPETSGLVR